MKMLNLNYVLYSHPYVAHRFNLVFLRHGIAQFAPAILKIDSVQRLMTRLKGFSFSVRILSSIHNET